MKSEEVLQVLERERQTIRGFGVRCLGLFGSCARGEHIQGSDLDFVVDFDRATFRNYFGLKFFLEDLFGCPVDLVFEDTIKPRLREPILNEVIYAAGL